MAVTTTDTAGHTALWVGAIPLNQTATPMSSVRALAIVYTSGPVEGPVLRRIFLANKDGSK